VNQIIFDFLFSGILTKPVTVYVYVTYKNKYLSLFGSLGLKCCWDARAQMQAAFVARSNNCKFKL